MKDTVLLTFGCSWTFGEGSGYEDGMTEMQYEKIRENEKICYENGWRKKVVEYFDVEHINFSEPGSSNDLQFRLCKQFFISNKFKDLRDKYKNIIVLWGITSTYRYDFWCKDTNRFEKILLNTSEEDVKKFGEYKDHIGLTIKKLSYNDFVRKRQLEIEISFFNQYFKLINIKNYWFDTFYSIDYKIKPQNFFDIEKKQRDLLNVLCNKHSDSYSNLNVTNHFEYAKDNGIINLYSLHPKKDGYKLIANYFIEKLKEVM